MSVRIWWRARTAGLACAGVAMIAGVAGAQATESGPSTGGKSVLVTRASVYTAYDQDLLRTLPTYVPLEVSGWYTGASAGANYVNDRQNSTLTLAGLLDGRQYNKFNLVFMNRYVASGRFDAKVARHTTLSFGGFGDRRPAFRRGGIDDDVDLDDGVTSLEIPNFDQVSFLQVPSTGFGGHFTLAQQLSTRSSLAISYSRGETRYDAVDLKTRRQTAAIHWRQQISRNLSANLGYRDTEYRYGRASLGTTVGHIDSLDASLAFGGHLTEHTELSVTGGAGSTTRRDGRDPAVRALGGIAVTTTVNPQWSLSAGYARGLRFIEGLSDPVTFDRLHASLVTQITRRARATARLSYSHGEVLNQPARSSYSLLSAQAGVEYALARPISLSVLYHLYGYDFAEPVVNPLGVPKSPRRNSIQIGLSLTGRRPLP